MLLKPRDVGSKNRGYKLELSHDRGEFKTTNFVSFVYRSGQHRLSYGYEHYPAGGRRCTGTGTGYGYRYRLSTRVALQPSSQPGPSAGCAACSAGCSSACRSCAVQAALRVIFAGCMQAPACSLHRSDLNCRLHGGLWCLPLLGFSQVGALSGAPPIVRLLVGRCPPPFFGLFY